MVAPLPCATAAPDVWPCAVSRSHKRRFRDRRVAVRRAQLHSQAILQELSSTSEAKGLLQADAPEFIPLSMQEWCHLSAEQVLNSLLSHWKLVPQRNLENSVGTIPLRRSLRPPQVPESLPRPLEIPMPAMVASDKMQNTPDLVPSAAVAEVVVAADMSRTNVADTGCQTDGMHESVLVQLLRNENSKLQKQVHDYTAGMLNLEKDQKQVQDSFSRLEALTSSQQALIMHLDTQLADKQSCITSLESKLHDSDALVKKFRMKLLDARSATVPDALEAGTQCPDVSEGLAHSDAIAAVSSFLEPVDVYAARCTSSRVTTATFQPTTQISSSSSPGGHVSSSASAPSQVTPQFGGLRSLGELMEALCRWVDAHKDAASTEVSRVRTRFLVALETVSFPGLLIAAREDFPDVFHLRPLKRAADLDRYCTDIVDVLSALEPDMWPELEDL